MLTIKNFENVTGSEFADIIIGDRKDNELRGRGGNDDLDGGKGDDRLVGGDGRDDLVGGKGDDVLIGGDGRDDLRGSGGDDEINGGKGNDLLAGGGGADTFQIRRGDGTDTFTDFQVGVDVIEFLKIRRKHVTVEDVGDDAVVSVTIRDKLTNMLILEDQAGVEKGEII